MKMLILLSACFCGLLFSQDEPQEIPKRWFLEAEAGPAWQSRNEVQIPGKTGTRFSLTEFGSGPFLAGRIYAGYRWTQKSEFRVLVAPLSVTGKKTLDSAINFQGQTFNSGTEVSSLYKFNSYRLTYRYQLVDNDTWRFWIGFTGKVRDAEISLSQSSQKASKSDLGFVPLLHLKAQWLLGEKWYLELDADALAAPQGRAEDVVLRANFELSPSVRGQVGYRLLEGGADNDSVYTFAFLHYAVVGMQVDF